MKHTVSATITTTMSVKDLATHLQAQLASIQSDFATLKTLNTPETPQNAYISVDLHLTMISPPHNRLPLSGDSNVPTAGPIPDALLLPKERRYPKTSPERAFRSLAESKGWTVSRSAWPTFFLSHPISGLIALVVCKASRGRRLKKAQLSLLRLLSTRHSVPCYRYDPATGLDLLSSGVLSKTTTNEGYRELSVVDSSNSPISASTATPEFIP